MGYFMGPRYVSSQPQWTIGPDVVRAGGPGVPMKASGGGGAHTPGTHGNGGVIHEGKEQDMPIRKTPQGEVHEIEVLTEDAVDKERKRCWLIVLEAFAPNQGERMDPRAVDVLYRIIHGEGNGKA